MQEVFSPAESDGIPNTPPGRMFYVLNNLKQVRGRGVAWHCSGTVSVNWGRNGNSMHESVNQLKAYLLTHFELGSTIRWCEVIPPLGGKLVRSLRFLQDELALYIEQVEKKVHVPRSELVKAIGLVIDNLVAAETSDD